MAAPVGNQHHVNIRSALRRNSLVSDPEDMLLLREKLTRIAVGSFAARQQGDGVEREQEEEEDDDEFDEHGEGYRCAGRGARRRRRPPPFQVFGLPPGERPSTPPSSPQPRDVLRKQLRIKNQVAAARRRLGSASVAGSDEDEDVETSFPCRKPRAASLLGTTFVSVDEVEITRLEEAVGEASIAPRASSSVSVAAASPTQAVPASSPRVRLSIPNHLRVSSTFSVLNKCPEGMRKRKSVHVEEAAVPAASGNAMSRQGGGSLKKTSSQVNMLSHENAEDLGSRMFKSYSSGALFHRCEGDDSDDQDMEEAWPDPEPPESPEASLGHPEK